MDPFKEKRNISAVSHKTKVFIISQALAEKQLRLSGVNFFQMDGKLGNTGKQLEFFLNLFGQSVFPPKEIILKDGNIIPKCDEKYLPVYNTEITQCFPGKSKKGDRKPEKDEINNCLSKNFLFDEIRIIKPKLLLLMGRLSIETFYKYVLNKTEKRTTNKLLNRIVTRFELPSLKLKGHQVKFAPIQHASGLNPNYKKMLDNKSLIKLIRSYLNE